MRIDLFEDRSIMKLWQFEPLDTCFFRGAQSFNAGEGGFLDSQFPPTAQTLAGIVRSSIAESMGVDWETMHRGGQEDIASLIGRSADDCGELRFTGPYLLKSGERLYAVPLHLLYSEKENTWRILQPGKDRLKTDRGDLYLPEPRGKSLEGAKPMERAWLDLVNMQKVLAGGEPKEFYNEKDMFVLESRAGIARNNQTRQAVDGALYFTRHVRLKEGITLGMGVIGAGNIKPGKMVRLGGEGRMAHLYVEEGMNFRPTPSWSQPLQGLDAQGDMFTIILLTHGDFNGESQPAFPKGLKLVSACVGKAVREGGWDYRKRQPKPLKSLVPAGSCYFVQGDITGLENHVGERTSFGYGEIAIGIWK